MARILTFASGGGSSPDQNLVGGDTPFRFTSAFTAATWIRFNNLVNSGDADWDYLCKLSSGFTDGWSLRAHNVSGSTWVLNSVEWSVAAAGYVGNPANTSLVTNLWIHAAVTYDGTAIRIFLNGKIDGITAMTGLIGTATSNVVINGTTTAASFGGVNATMAETYLSPFALSPNQMNDLYRSGIWPRSVPLAAYWPLNGTLATAVELDNSGNGNNLTVNTFSTPLRSAPGPVLPARIDATNIRQVMWSQGAATPPLFLTGSQQLIMM